MTQSIDYRIRTRDALCAMVAGVLRDVAEHGLPGNHHFLLTFRTDVAGVDIPEWMRAEYPEEMTIVVQNWFENLSVTDDRFSITLSFRNQAEPIVVPFAALKSFVDPSVEFGLQLDMPQMASGPNLVEADADVEEPESTEPEKAPAADGEVISLDAFRKD